MNAPLPIPNEPKFALRRHIMLLHDYEPGGCNRATEGHAREMLTKLQASEHDKFRRSPLPSS
jgi:hypothetical protein